MTIRTPAKINLDLRVGPRRADGFHPIRSWFITVGLYDTLTFMPADDISLTCDDPTVPADARNLVWRAAEALRTMRPTALGCGSSQPGVAIRLDKQIPSAAGLGGGSSNAAATLVALNRFWQLGHDLDDLHTLAGTLGSDVPFFLRGPSSVCTGRGDIVTPVPRPACGWALLILPALAMPTPAVFRRLDDLRLHQDLPGGADGWDQPIDFSATTTTANHLLPRLSNDLERPAFDLSPMLAALHTSIERCLSRPVRMSGSGSTLFTLFDHFDDAIAASEKISGLAAAVIRVVETCPEFDTF